MRSHITYWSKNYLSCTTCKSANVVLVFFTNQNISDVIKASNEGKIKLVCSDKADKIKWLCKDCYQSGNVSGIH